MWFPTTLAPPTSLFQRYEGCSRLFEPFVRDLSRRSEAKTEADTYFLTACHGVEEQRKDGRKELAIGESDDNKTSG